MKVLIFSFSNNKVNEDSFIPNEKGYRYRGNVNRTWYRNLIVKNVI